MMTPETPTAAEHHREGMARLLQGRGAEALALLERAHNESPDSALYRSAYALGMALVSRDFGAAVQLARSAVRDEFHNPEVYLNLARIYESFGHKAEAIRYLRRGLLVDPENDELLRMRTRLGIRQRPALRFLPREHLINRMLGGLQARLRPFRTRQRRTSDRATSVAH
jgi:tetratricopeptide (TPR) repeat protein